MPIKHYQNHVIINLILYIIIQTVLTFSLTFAPNPR